MRATTVRHPMVASRRLVAMVAVLGLLSISCSDVFTGNDRVRGSGEVTVEARPITDYERVVLAGEGSVLFGTGSDGFIEVETDTNLFTHIRTDVSGDTLTISTESGIDIDPTSGVSYRLGCPEMTNIVLSGAGSINLASCAATDLLQIDLSGAGSIAAPNLEVSSLQASLPGAGSITVSGRTDLLNVILAGAGDFDGRDLLADTVTVESLGVGKTTVWAANELTVTATGVGTVRYYGEPEVSSTVTGVGTVEALGPK